MTHFGTIKSYDSGKGSGTITPEKGGDAPEQGQRWGYETRQVDGGKPSATNLRRQEQEQGKKQQEGERGTQGAPRAQAH